MPEKSLQLVVRDLFMDFGLHIADVVHRCLYTLFVCFSLALCFYQCRCLLVCGSCFCFCRAPELAPHPRGVEDGNGTPVALRVFLVQ